MSFRRRRISAPSVVNHPTAHEHFLWLGVEELTARCNGLCDTSNVDEQVVNGPMSRLLTSVATRCISKQYGFVKASTHALSFFLSETQTTYILYETRNAKNTKGTTKPRTNRTLANLAITDLAGIGRYHLTIQLLGRDGSSSGTGYRMGSFDLPERRAFHIPYQEKFGPGFLAPDVC